MDGIRPTSVTVKLLADGKETGQTLLLSEANNWTGAFTDLDLYKEGELVKYEIQEQGVYGYTSVINGTPDSGYMITNVHEVKTYIQHFCLWCNVIDRVSSSVYYQETLC